MDPPRRSLQPKITAFFGKKSAVEQSSEVVKAIEEREDLPNKEKEVLVVDVHKELMASSITGVKLNSYTDAQRTEIVNATEASTEEEGLALARRKFGLVVPITTLRTWLMKRKRFRDAYGGASHFISQARGPKHKIPEDVSKWVLQNLKGLLDKGVTITHLVARSFLKLAYKKFEFHIPSRMDYVTRTFLRRNNFVRRAITHTAADLPAKEQREAQWKEFKSLFHKFCEENNVAMEDVLGADETGINVLPRATHTLAIRGARQVPGLVKKALAQITKVTAISLVGKLLAYQLIFGGKTEAVFPKDVEPAPGSFYSATPSHFANAATTLEFVEKIIIPHIESNRLKRIADGTSTKEVEDKRWAALIWDNFSAHKDAQVEALLASHRIKSFFLPPNCTSIYQALDVMFNGNEKQVLRAHFAEWHFRTLQLALQKDTNAMDVLPKTAAKKRSLIATLIRGVHEIMAQKTDLICRAWAKTGLYDEPQEAMETEDIQTDDLLVTEMLRMTLDKPDDVELMDVDDDFDNVLDFMPQAPADYGIHDLHDDDDHDVDEPSVNSEDVADDSDDESFVPSPKRGCYVELEQTMDDQASTSAESSHRVELERVKEGGAVQVTFTGKAKPTARELLVIMMSQKMVPQDTTILSISEITSTGFKMSLSGVRSSTLAGEHPAIVWFD